MTEMPTAPGPGAPTPPGPADPGPPTQLIAGVEDTWPGRQADEATTTLYAPPARPPVTVIGVADDRLDLLAPEARQALAEAEVVVGDRRQLHLWQSWPGRQVTVGGWQPETVEAGPDTTATVRTVRQRAVEASRRVCVLVAGDPGFFGIVRVLVAALDRRDLRILPAPSSVSLSFARLGLPWEDAIVVSVEGATLASSANILRTARKAAVLTSPEVPPEALGQALLKAGTTMDLVAVCSRLGTADEAVTELTLEQLAAGRFDPLSVVVLVGPGSLQMTGWSPGQPPPTTVAGHGGISDQALSWGLPDSAFTHRVGLITKAEVRSVVLGKLALPASGVMWDVGAGSGSVAIECALLRPGLTVMAVEEDPEEAARISTNALALEAGVHVVGGRAPEALADLPAPDRAFVGGGGIAVLEAVLDQLRPGGRVAATFAALDAAAAAAERLGNLVQVGVARGERGPHGGWRLTARNPMFVVWGPGPSSPEEPESDEPS